MSKVYNMVGGGGGGIKLSSIAITTAPTKTTYTAGETFDPAGMVVTATYTNGATLQATGYTFSPSTALTDGTSSVTILYTEGGVTKTTTQAITVIHRLESVAVTTQPTTTSYEYGGTFSTTGMVVTATYSDGTTDNVAGYTCSPSALNTVGTQTVTVSYTERDVTKTTTLSVTVNRKTISAVPSQSGTLTYSGSAQSPSWSNYNAAQLTLGGVTNGTNAGSYNATFTPTANYRWSNGTTTAKTVAWSIGKAAGDLSISPTTMTLDTTTSSKTITVTRAGTGTVSAASSSTAVATVSVSGTTVTVTGVASGSATITVSVAADSNYTAPADKTCAVTANFLSNTFNANTWEAIIGACQSGSVPAAWVVGNQKTMTINSVSYTVTIIGKGHDSYTGGGTAPLTFQLQNCYGTKYYMNDTSNNTNSGGWASCTMRSTSLPAILALMPLEVQTGIKAVDKLTSAGSQSSTINTSSDKLFLLSEIEIFSTIYSKAGEGSQYAYYTSGNSRVKNFSGSAEFWWTRSPHGSDPVEFCVITDNGYSSSYYPAYPYGVSFGFCF